MSLYLDSARSSLLATRAHGMRFAVLATWLIRHRIVQEIAESKT